MTELHFLRDLVVLFGASIVVVYGFNRLRLPAVVGFLVAGALLGPYGLDVVNDVARVEVFAEVGVVLLLFTIGVEFSLGQLRSLRTVIGAGLLQIVSAIVLSALAAIAFGLPLNQGVFWAFLTEMSSTAVVLKLVTERGETISPHGRVIIGVLLVQDVAVVPMMVVTPVLGGLGEAGLLTVVWSVAKAILAVLLILVAAWYLVPRLLVEVVRSRSRELFVITVILVCLGIAWLSSLAGLSPALGAFIMGLIISERDSSHQATAATLPFRDSCTSPFLLQASPRLARRTEALQRLRHWLPERQADPNEIPSRHLRDHTVVAGYGVNGRNLVQVLREIEIPFVAVDVDGETVRQEQKKGIPIVFGDITHPQVVRRLGIQDARALVLAISDPIATRRAVTVARQLSPAIHIIARTRYLREIEDLRATGADQVVPEEFETSIEIF